MTISTMTLTNDTGDLTVTISDDRGGDHQFKVECDFTDKQYGDCIVQVYCNNERDATMLAHLLVGGWAE
jgi:hypothetical protein|tara:strand:+ start:690 stop:896 length:207 start_codon:yes stop_codon:yes gene_type:complete